MRIVQINATCGVGSTGKICVEISKLLCEENIENYILFSNGKTNYELGIKYQNILETKLSALKSRVLGNFGFNSVKCTDRLISIIKKINPDIVHLHNLHNHNCNLDLLLTFFKKTNIKIIWTFHDCWSFTGYCTHFTLAKCTKWVNGCSHCVLFKEYSWFFDRSLYLYNKKKELFRGLDLTIVTPSNWLADLVRTSYLSEKEVKVIHNGIDVNIFKPTRSNFRREYNLSDKKIILGVSFGWGVKKGYNDILNLARIINVDYVIVLIGLSKQQISNLPPNIIGIEKTNDAHELAGIYSEADVFINATYEDTYPTVNLEALACGTPVVTYNTGGSPESAGQNAIIVDQGDIIGLKDAIEKTVYANMVLKINPDSFSAKNKFKEYVDLYKSIL